MPKQSLATEQASSEPSTPARPHKSMLRLKRPQSAPSCGVNSQPTRHFEKLMQAFERNPKRKLAAYNTHDVISAIRVDKYITDPVICSAHLKLNRLLQTNFLMADRTGAQLLEDIRTLTDTATQAQRTPPIKWLTDIACPNIEAAIQLQIAKHLYCYYRCLPDAVPPLMHTIYTEMTKHRQDFPSLSTCPSPQEDQATAQARINHDRALRKQVLAKADRFVSDWLDSNQPFLHCEIGIPDTQPIKKPTPKFGRNHDLVLLGAAGSGKSTLKKLRLASQKGHMKDYISLCTDDYRGVILHGFAADKHESIVTRNAYIKTQDLAYLLKQLIEEELTHASKLAQVRPNVVIDGVTLEKWHSRIIMDSQAGASQRVSFDIVALTQVDAIAPSAHLRPQLSTTLADRNRYINTKSLLAGHAKNAALFLQDLPVGISIALCHSRRKPTRRQVQDSKCAKDKQPFTIIAEINTEAKLKPSLEIFDLQAFADFAIKTKINQQARSESELYLDRSRRRGQFMFSASEKIQSILSLLIDDAKSITINMPKELSELTINATQPQQRVKQADNLCTLAFDKTTNKITLDYPTKLAKQRFAYYTNPALKTHALSAVEKSCQRLLKLLVRHIVAINHHRAFETLTNNSGNGTRIVLSSSHHIQAEEMVLGANAHLRNSRSCLFKAMSNPTASPSASLRCTKLKSFLPQSKGYHPKTKRCR